MGNFSKTVQNSIQSFGPAPSTKWGTGNPYNMTWGVSKWGEGTQDLIVYVYKLISNSFAISDATFFSISFVRAISETLSFAGDMTSETLQSGAYYYVFPGPTTEAEGSASPTYVSGSASASTYTTVSAGNITWS